jgi:predicted TIM-barrel fold metal-dependent hydrolase
MTRRGVTLAAAAMSFAPSAFAQGRSDPPEIIDIHAHIRTPDFARFPPLPSVAARPGGPGGRGQTVEQLIAEMDAAGVAKAACVQLSTFYGMDDAYVADSVPRYPQRLTGVCSIDVAAPDATAKLQALLAHGMTGLRVFNGGTDERSTASFDDPRSFPVWALCQDRRVTVSAQVTAAELPKVRAMAERFPKVLMVIDHGAHPDLSDGAPFAAAKSLFDMAGLPNVHVKVTPPLFAQARMGKSTPQAFMEAMVKAFGANRLAFGSNLPMTAGPLTKIVAETKDALSTLSPADRAMVFAGTAKKLYPKLA